MPIRVYKPTTNARRNASVNMHAEVTKKSPEKSLLRPLHKTGGRNCQGKLTVIQQGGGHKRRYRLIDFKRQKDDMKAMVVGIEYDPNRTCHIALLKYEDGTLRYILCPKGLTVGAKVVSSQNAVEPDAGNCMPLKHIPTGLDVHCIEMTPGKGGALCRAAGMAARLTNKEGRLASLVLPSGEIRQVLLECRATVGSVGNPDNANVVIGKAGRARWLGRRPRTRGVAMSHHQHPQGGGEGHNPIGMKRPKTPWGKPALGVKTRKHGKKSDSYILQRRRSKKK